MSFGFRSISSGGIAQIDGGFQNFVLVQSGVASGNFYNIPLVDQPQNIIAMVRINYGQQFFTKSSTNPSYEYRIYARQNLNQQQGGHGIVVNNSSGIRVFDSGVKKLNVRAVHYLTLTNLLSQATFPSVGFRPFVGIGCLETTGAVSQNPVMPGMLRALFFQQNANNTVTFLQNFFAGAPPGLNAFWGGGTKSIILGD